MMQRKITREYRLVDFHEKKEEMVLDFEGLEVGWYEGVLGLAMGNGIWLVTGFFFFGVKIVCLSLFLFGFVSLSMGVYVVMVEMFRPFGGGEMRWG